MIIVEVDASYTDEGIGVGWVIKTWSEDPEKIHKEVERGGDFIGHPQGKTSEQAEYAACVRGVRESLRHSDGEHLKLYTDCKPVAEKIRDGNPSNGDRKLQENLDVLLEEYDEWNVKWVPRSSNTVADSEARVAREEAKCLSHSSP